MQSAFLPRDETTAETWPTRAGARQLLELETNPRRNFSVTKSAAIGLCPGSQTGEDCRAEGAERGEGGDKNRGYSF